MDIVPFKVILDNMCREIVNEVGLGHHETVYQNALKLLFRKNNIMYQEEVVKEIRFYGEQIGSVRLDLIVNKSESTPVIIELKSILNIHDKEINQVQRYKDLTNIEEAYIINFSYKDYTILKV